MRALYAFLITLFLVGLSKDGLADVPEYFEVERLAFELIERCPPSECALIFVGRSGTAIAAYLETLSGTPTLQVPLTKFRSNPFGPQNPIRYDHPLTEMNEKKLFAHFDAYIDLPRIAGKKILTVDYVISGESQFAFTAYLKRWMKSRGRSETVAALPFALEGGFSMLKKTARTFHVEIEDLVGITPDAVDPFMGEHYDRRSAYGTFDLSESPPVGRVPMRQEYRELVDEITQIQRENEILEQERAARRWDSPGARFRRWVIDLRKRICARLLRSR